MSRNALARTRPKMVDWKMDSPPDECHDSSRHRSSFTAATLHCRLGPAGLRGFYRWIKQEDWFWLVI